MTPESHKPKRIKYLCYRQQHKTRYLDRMTRVFWLAVAAAFTLTASAIAQVPTGTIAGRVTSADGVPLAGVAVSVSGPNLQGVRTAVTSDTGDYLLPLLPPGEYVLVFEISSFEPVRHH